MPNFNDDRDACHVRALLANEAIRGRDPVKMERWRRQLRILKVVREAEAVGPFTDAERKRIISALVKA